MDYEKFLPLAPRDLLVLSALAEGPLHGYGIIKAVELRSGSGVMLDPANLYRVLRRMRRVGWIEVAKRTSESDFQGEAGTDRRITYQITGFGRSLLGAELVRLERLLRFARLATANGFPTPEAEEEV